MHCYMLDALHSVFRRLPSLMQPASLRPGFKAFLQPLLSARSKSLLLGNQIANNMPLVCLERSMPPSPQVLESLGVGPLLEVLSSGAFLDADKAAYGVAVAAAAAVKEALLALRTAKPLPRKVRGCVCSHVGGRGVWRSHYAAFKRGAL